MRRGRPKPTNELLCTVHTRSIAVCFANVVSPQQTHSLGAKETARNCSYTRVGTCFVEYEAPRVGPCSAFTNFGGSPQGPVKS